MNTITLSLPKTKHVRGYAIRKLPLGAYAEALEAINTMPADLIRSCFPEAEGDPFQGLSSLTGDALISILTRALAAVPSHAFALLSNLLEIDVETLKTDRAIGLDGIAEMLSAWVEVNDVENFLKAVHALSQKWTAAKYPQPSAGFSALLHKGLSWVSAKKNS